MELELPEEDLGFLYVQPCFTHRALSSLKFVGTNNEDSIVTTSSKQSVASTVGIPQGPTVNPIGHYDQKAQRSYADVVRDNRSTHSIELIK